MAMLKNVAMADSKVEVVKTAEEKIIPDNWIVVRGEEWAVSIAPSVFDNLDESAAESFKESLGNFMDTVIGNDNKE